MIALLVVTDGRLEYLEQTIASAAEMLRGPITERWLFDDTGDRAHRAMLRARYPEFVCINGGPRQGFGGAIAAAWRHLVSESAARWIVHLEQDFTFNRTIDLEAMVAVLEANPHLAQMALRRQPWNDEERAAGGIVEQHPEDFVDRAAGEREWLEHRRFWTTNPSLYRRSLIEGGWPCVRHSEGAFTRQLLADPALRFGFWGSRTSGEWVTHIGYARNGNGY